MGIRYYREKESVPVGAKGFKPDFTLPDHDCALEVKLVTKTHGIAKVQEEIAADTATYPIKWKRVIFAIYDIGEIENPVQFKSENVRELGVSVVIVKH